MPVVVRDGADLYWNKTGAGPALILGAGLNGSGMWWDGCSSRPDSCHPGREIQSDQLVIEFASDQGVDRRRKQSRNVIVRHHPPDIVRFSYLLLRSLKAPARCVLRTVRSLSHRSRGDAAGSTN